MVRFNRSFALRLATALTLATTLYATAQACTRLVYLGPNDNVITARSMDWKNDIATHLWIFPRGMERSGEAGNRSLHWTSRYGSVIASGYDISTTDGLNEAGLMANVLWLVESQYPEFTGKKPGLTIAAWAQYVLDNFATVEEAVSALRCVKSPSQSSRTKSRERNVSPPCIYRYPIHPAIAPLSSTLKGNKLFTTAANTR